MSIDFRAVAQEPIVASRSQRLYSARQTAIGTFFGGPVALAYFLGSNYAALGDNRGRRLAMLWAGLLAAFLLALGLLEVYWTNPVSAVLGRLSMPVNIASVIAARSVAQKQIASSRQYDLYSNVRVCVATVACLLGSVLAIYVFAFLVVFAVTLVEASQR